MISAPNVNAVGERRDAANFSVVCSLEFVLKKIYRGRIVEKRTTGATIAASLELENQTLMKNAKVTSDMQNKKKKANRMPLSEWNRKEREVMNQMESETQKKRTKATRNQLS